MNGFDPADYRRRVLAAVLKRGGPESSDPFELYDLPVDDDLDDAAVAERVAAVWGFWQRQRDHPKYRVLAAELVAGHEARSAELLDAGRRRTAAARVRAQREQRDAQRYALLDAAVARLVDRHRGIPADKVEGLHEVGALAGLTPEEVTARLRRHRRVAAGEQERPSGVPVERRRQVRALLDEFGRLTDAPAPPTLLALLGLDASATGPQVRAGAGAWRSRARELPPNRLRTVVDELLVHVAELLEPGAAAVAAYLDAVAADVTEHLRPRIRAAVLVEDRLVAEDHAHLLDEARALGLDDARARAVLAAVARELGAPIETDPVPAAPPPPTPPPAPPRERGWEAPLRAARAALRAARPGEARRLVEAARRLAGPEGATPVRAVADEIAGVLDEAARRWTAASAAVDARRSTEAAEHLEHLDRTARDVPDPRGADLDDLLARVRRDVARADAAVAAALAGPAADRAAALLAVLGTCPGHPGAEAALAAIPVEPPSWVRAARDGRGDVLVVWEASPTPQVRYKVSRRRPDGSWQVVGRVTDTSVLDGGAPPAVEAPVYAVEAVQAGRSSAAVRSDERTPPSTPPPVEAPVSGVAGPSAVRAERGPTGSVVVRWTGPPGAEYRVRCAMPGGRWRVVGRTREHEIEDGGAPDGPLPGYTVSASVGGERSAEVPTT
ncbi:Ig-like domain repeat protein [Pseudonocardia broussonetiae]|uniref:Ig-like domain repeat protein n=1 Tax=Pseudonocardia broussonetiae TaxID=2736640 RepID=A0A6M6JK09_9PSEU|nr:Ig-like domain repeat protein [Pseudonocardia broussonetiae]QJY48388.1 Ig-like domain repeat protein [Pseudonocardia broussonetiae]